MVRGCVKSEAQFNTDKLTSTSTTKCQMRKMAILKAGLVYQMSSVYASYIITVEEERGASLWGAACWEGGTAVAVSTEKETAVVEGRVTAKSVSLLWSVMSALLLKIAQERTTGVTLWMRVRVQLVLPWGRGDTGDGCVQTCGLWCQSCC